MLTKIESACANTILECFFKRDRLITHMKLQKILYFSTGTYVATENRPMTEQLFQAWPYGPVLPNLYYQLRMYGDSDITELIEFENSKYSYKYGEVFDTIVSIVEKLGNLTAWELSEKTHAKNGPWFQTVDKKGYKKDIDFNLIKEYFTKNPVL